MPKLLSIAINDYPKTNRKLKGAINDSRLWSGWFASRGWEVETLWNQEATSQQILAAIERMMRQAQAGDRLAIHFSGHGTQVVDAGGDEVDSLDECYCPWDVTEKGPIRDDQLFNLFQMRSGGVQLYLIADCCHSGSLHRGPKAVVRYLPLTEKSGRRSKSRREPAAARTAGLLLAASREDEQARETSFRGQSFGVFTHAALQTLQSMPPKSTHRQWLEAIRKAVRPSQQTPELIGNRQLMDESIFGGPLND